MHYTNKEHSVVAVYCSHAAAEAGVRALQQAGLDMKRLSIVGKDFQNEEQVIGFFNSGDRMKFWGGRGAVWGTLWGMLFGGAFLLVPAIGPLVVMGPLVGWIRGALEGASVGGAAGVLASALSGLGLPADSVSKYDVAVRAGSFLVLVRGPANVIAHACSVLAPTEVADLIAHAG